MAETGLEGRVLGGRYRLKRLLAVGGMGAVWAAEDAVLGREVAVKVLGEALAGDRRAALRLRREARAAGRLAHPGIARVLDLGEDGAGRPYLVMELLHGESLAARLARAGPLAPAEAVRVVAAAADALEVAHRAGIVHRDVKPGNVFVTGGGDVKLLDFGIASAANEAALTGGDLLGTAAYLAPERVLGHDATPAADVYALGVLLYELLAGRPPFAGDTGTALAMAHVHARPAPLAAVAAQEVPPALAAACERALAKDPAARPPSAAALAALLRSTATPAPPPAPLPPTAPGAPTPAHQPAPALGVPTPVHPQPAASVAALAHQRPTAAVGVPTPVQRQAAAVGAGAGAGGAPTARGAAGPVRRRRGAWMVVAALLLAALLVGAPSLGLVPPSLGLAPPGGREPAGPVGQAPAGGQTPAVGQDPAGGQDPSAGGLGATEAGGRQAPAGGADQPGRDLGGDDGGSGGGDGGGDDGEGSGGGGSGGDGGGGGSSGSD
jgi:eukaryotic-like serine/threonine-protein kinase